MMRKISVLNQKGGVAKTTTTVNLGAALARMGQRVLLVDFDPQANLSSHLNMKGEEPTTSELLLTDVHPSDVVKPTFLPGLDLIPSGIQLTQAEIQLVTELGREQRLHNRLSTYVETRYDFVLVDCPPSLGLLTLNALRFSGEALIPLTSGNFAQEGVALLVNTLSNIRDQLGHAVDVAGVVLTLWEPRQISSQQAEENLREFFGDRVFRTRIRKNAALEHASKSGVDIAQWDSKSHGARDYMALAQEVLNRAEPAKAKSESAA